MSIPTYRFQAVPVTPGVTSPVNFPRNWIPLWFDAKYIGRLVPSETFYPFGILMPNGAGVDGKYYLLPQRMTETGLQIISQDVDLSDVELRAGEYSFQTSNQPYGGMFCYLEKIN